MFDDLIFTASSVGPAEGARLSIGGEDQILRSDDFVIEDSAAEAQPNGEGKAAVDDEQSRQNRRRKRARRRQRQQAWRCEQLA